MPSPPALNGRVDSEIHLFLINANSLYLKLVVDKILLQHWWKFDVQGVPSDVGVDKYMLKNGQMITMSLESSDKINIIVQIKYIS